MCRDKLSSLLKCEKQTKSKPSKQCMIFWAKLKQKIKFIKAFVID